MGFVVIKRRVLTLIHIEFALSKSSGIKKGLMERIERCKAKSYDQKITEIENNDFYGAHIQIKYLLC